MLTDMTSDLCNAIDSLRDSFDEFDFITKDGHTLSELEGIDGFALIAVEDDETIPFSDFKKKIKHDFYSNDEDLSVRDFDWDLIESIYDRVASQYKSYYAFYSDVLTNMTGEQSIGTVEILSTEDLKDQLLEFASTHGFVYEIEHPELGAVYVLSEDFQKKVF